MRRRFDWRYGTLLAGLALAGCTGFRDELDYRGYNPVSWAQKDDPLVVLRDSDSGDKRARALRSIREPLRHGGTPQEQEVIVQVLSKTAASDPRPICRLTAVQTLGTFQDPRAVEALKDAYYQATSLPAETATVVQVAALEALGQTKNPEAIALLANVVREPAPALTVPAAEKRQSRDRRVAAARALGRYHQPEAAQALVQLMRSERDVTVRTAAHESLQACTGRKLPADPAAWENMLAEGYQPPESGKINLLGWFQME